jgi:hypothetical protein
VSRTILDVKSSIFKLVRFQISGGSEAKELLFKYNVCKLVRYQIAVGRLDKEFHSKYRLLKFSRFHISSEIVEIVLLANDK